MREFTSWTLLGLKNQATSSFFVDTSPHDEAEVSF